MAPDLNHDKMVGMKRSWRRFLITAALVVALLPVRFGFECTYDSSGGMDMVGICSDAGRSLIGVPIPPVVLSAASGLLLLGLILAPFIYLGYRLDRRSNRQVDSRRSGGHRAALMCSPLSSSLFVAN